MELGAVYESFKVEETGEGELVFKGTHLVPPKVSRKKLVQQSHSIHQSGETIYNQVRKFWFWPDMKNMIMTKARGCTTCRIDKKSKERQVNVEPVELYEYGPGELWSTDLFQIPKGRGFQYFIIVVDRISGFIHCKKIPNMTAQTVTS